jgi:hypothetical protein
METEPTGGLDIVGSIVKDALYNRLRQSIGYVATPIPVYLVRVLDLGQIILVFRGATLLDSAVEYEAKLGEPVLELARGDV